MWRSLLVARWWGFTIFLVWGAERRNPVVDLALFGRPQNPGRHGGDGRSLRLVRLGNVVLLPLWWWLNSTGYTATLHGLVLAPVGLFAIFDPVRGAVSDGRSANIWDVALRVFAALCVMRQHLTPTHVGTCFVPSVSYRVSPWRFSHFPDLVGVCRDLPPESIPGDSGLFISRVFRPARSVTRSTTDVGIGAASDASRQGGGHMKGSEPSLITALATLQAGGIGQQQSYGVKSWGDQRLLAVRG